MYLCSFFYNVSREKTFVFYATTSSFEHLHCPLSPIELLTIRVFPGTLSTEYATSCSRGAVVILALLLVQGFRTADPLVLVLFVKTINAVVSTKKGLDQLK